MSQYDKHTLHCVLGSVSSNSHNSMFPTSWIICFDSWLKGFNDWLCCWSRWRAWRFGWFSIFWINYWTLAPCDCFTAECGSPGMLKSMSSSWIARLNSLFVLNDAISRCSSGACCSFTVCALELLHSSDCLIHREFVQHGYFQTNYELQSR